MVLPTTATILNGCARHSIDMQFEVLTQPGDEATVELGIDTFGGFAQVTFVGPITMTTLGIAFRALTHHRDYVNQMPVVWDFSRASFTQVDPVRLQQLITYMSTREDRHHTKIAIVVAGNLERSYTRIYDSLALVEVPQTRALFTDVAAAIAWLTPTAA